MFSIATFQAAKLGPLRRTLVMVVFAALAAVTWFCLGDSGAPAASPAPVVHSVRVVTVRPVVKVTHVVTVRHETIITTTVISHG